jgi:glycosyltransferase involved in cell wall biosynthesis
MGGDGPLTPAHRARVTELGLESRVRFIGRVDEAELPALLRGAELYVTASETDGTSVTLLQAMACGVPVIASRNAGNITWIREGETGRLFGVGDVGALAALFISKNLQSAQEASAALALVKENANWSLNRLRLGASLRG